jgi:diadenylate cyclase
MHGGFISTLWHGLRWQDGADVLLLTILFSWAYTWMRRTIAVQTAFGMITLLAASWIASHFGLILTSYLLSAVSAVATIVVVVVFQREIRRGLSRASPLRWIRTWSRRPRVEAPAAVVAQAAFALAAAGKGALIVLPRHDWVGEYISGGLAIDARLSSALLEAVFTSTAPLHDGAVVVGNERLAWAGGVLPLAADTGDPRHGTRHRAALGLASASDAVVVCVSEERGTVLVAHDAGLTPVPSQAELRDLLEELGSGRRVRSKRPTERPRRTADVLAYVAIFVGVVLAWSAMVQDRSHVVGRVIPLEIRGVSDTLRFDPPRFASVAVELRSSRREIDLLAPDAVQAFIDIAESSSGSHTFRVHTYAPAGVEVMSVVPSTISLQLRKREGETPATPR